MDSSEQIFKVKVAALVPFLPERKNAKGEVVEPRAEFKGIVVKNPSTAAEILAEYKDENEFVQAYIEQLDTIRTREAGNAGRAVTAPEADALKNDATREAFTNSVRASIQTAVSSITRLPITVDKEVVKAEASTMSDDLANNRVDLSDPETAAKIAALLKSLSGK